MSYLRIAKDGLHEFEWDSGSQTYVSEKVPQARIISRLRMSCRIDDEVTLGDIFKFVGSYPLLTFFVSHYSWCWKIKAFHEQALLTPVPDTGEKLTHLEISRYVEIDEDDLNEHLHFGAIGGPDENGNTHWGVSLSPMNEIAHLPVKLVTTADVMKDHMRVSEAKCYFTLLEVLDAIYDDISFHGGPEETAAFGRELQGMIADIEAGTATLTPLEDVLGKEPIN